MPPAAGRTAPDRPRRAPAGKAPRPGAPPAGTARAGPAAAGIEPELPPGARILPAGRRFLPARGPCGPAAVRGYSPAAASALASGDSFAAGSSLAAATAATASFAARTAPLAMSVTEGFFAPA